MSITIKFKSTPENWKKEYSGLKRNTVRKCDKEDDIRFEVLGEVVDGICNLVNIEIENTKTREVFTRNVTDVTFWDGRWIISW